MVFFANMGMLATFCICTTVLPHAHLSWPPCPQADEVAAVGEAANQVVLTQPPVNRRSLDRLSEAIQASIYEEPRPEVTLPLFQAYFTPSDFRRVLYKVKRKHWFLLVFMNSWCLLPSISVAPVSSSEHKQ